MIIGCCKLCNLLKSSLYHRRIQPITACSLLLWRRSQSHYKVNLSTRDLVEVVNQKAKIHKYIKPQEPEEPLYVNSLERCDSEEDLNVISENDQLDFGALSADNVYQKPYHESLVNRSINNIEKKSVIDELLSTDEVEEDPADCLRLSNVYRRHPPEHYCELIKRYCKAGDTNSALSVFFSEMLEKDRVLPSRFHAHMVLDGLARVGDSENAFRVYKKMTELGIDATQATYSRLFRACAEDIATWFRKNRTFMPPVVNRTENHSLLLQRKMLALQKALAPDMSPDNFGGPALHKVYLFWRRLMEKNIPMNQFTYNTLILALAKARGCQTKESVKQLLRGFEIAATTPLSSIDLETNSIPREQNVHSQIVRPSFTFFSNLLSTSGFDWELKAFVIEYMRCPIHIDELSDKKSAIPKRDVYGNQVSNHFDGFVLDRRVIASIDIDIGLFRELLANGVIPKDGSPVHESKTGGFHVYPNAVRSFYRFYKIYKSWLRESPVAKPC
ncbi:unnamed protein product [Schistosoma intercalatum]|nr:unnamed protein product [Schistosoma intercalatum]